MGTRLTPEEEKFTASVGFAVRRAQRAGVQPQMLALGDMVLAACGNWRRGQPKAGAVLWGVSDEAGAANLKALLVPSCIAARVAAVVGALASQWEAAQVVKADVHFGAAAADCLQAMGLTVEAAQLREASKRANFAKHVGMFSVGDFGSASSGHLRQLQRGGRLLGSAVAEACPSPSTP